MAQGKLSPRQKMINMMYLIFIAMLALNMSKEVLTAFGVLNERLEESNVSMDNRITAFVDNLSEQASAQPEQYGEVKRKADQINTLSKDFDAFIADVKNQLDARANLAPEDMNNYEIQDTKDHLDQMLFSEMDIPNLEMRSLT